jgi:hypothetical protein
MKPDTAAACEAALSAIDRAVLLLDAEGRESITLDDPKDLVRTYAELREQATMLRESMKRFAKMEQAMSYEVIPSSFKRHGVEIIRLTGYGRVNLTTDFSCSIQKGKKEQGLQYLRDIGQGGMIIETVPAETLSAFARAYAKDEGRELPDNIFTTSVTTHCALTRSA